MNYTIFIRPLIGAGIGYITNWIAVKMMFRPLHPIKIGKFTLPFTPGIIPKNKSRLAESIGNTISNSLLTDNDLKNVLLSKNIKLEIKEKVINSLNSISENNSSLEEVICSYISQDTYSKTLFNIKSNLTSSIYNTIVEANLGDIISEQINIAAKEKLKGSILGLLGGNAIVSNITLEVPEKVNQYINTNGKKLICSMVEKEISKYTCKTLSEYATNIAASEIDLISIIMQIYEKLVNEKISSFLKTINISKIVTDKINDMDVLELEKMILLIMKKELNALVNLGAIIGFLLGFFNLLF